MSLISKSKTLVALALLAAPVAFCGPRVSIGDPTSATQVGLNFNFFSNSTGGGYFNFVNASGQTWNSIDLLVSEPVNTDITCNSPLFDACEISTLTASNGQALFDIGFEGINSSAGVAPGVGFYINLNDLIGDQPNYDPSGAGQWGSNTQFEAIANVPEPGTAGILLCVGAAALLLGGWRRFRHAA